jgi:Transcription factor WhiB
MAQGKMGLKLWLKTHPLLQVLYVWRLAYDQQTNKKRKVMDLDWQGKAACSNTDTESFFPEYNPDPEERGEEVLDALNALKICSTCTVSKQCLAYAMASEDSVNTGIYGGTLAYERQRMWKASGRAVMGGGAPRLEQAIRRHATKQGIPAPVLGVRLLKVLEERA